LIIFIIISLNIKTSKIKVFLHGEAYHAKEFCNQLENYKKGVFEPKYFENPGDLKNYEEFDLFHLISSPLPIIKSLKRHRKPIFYHWIGTDVYRFLNDFPLKKIFKKNLIKSESIRNLVVSENLKQELISLNVSSTVLPLVKLKFINKIPPLPQKFSVLAYLPEKRWDYYNGDIILQLAEKMPAVDFHIVASGRKDNKLKNVFTHGFIEDMKPFYERCSALIRLTVHDGLPKMVLEALSYGRHVLWNGSLPHCFKVSNFRDCFDVLNDLKLKSEPNVPGKEYVEKNFNPDNVVDDYLALCQELIVNR
jgi:hypothetical protein